MDIGNAVGLVLTFVGTAISLYQAYKAKTYRDEIASDRQKLILIELLPVVKHARDECKKIITPVNGQMRGVSVEKVIGSIQDCAEKIQEYSHRLSDTTLSSSAVSDIQSKISSYKTEVDPRQRHIIADTLYGDLNSVIQSLSTTIDQKI
ncbi:hypothetical protein [Vibrio europaeus]|uniref:hypothetical protein n=1 Tax=Vibrio europaeus TaxID=300876 RepID=UPI00148CB72E|nr:hypothetical protein [Vibrio europaeus]NOH22553.1 hypothetical protein [Vibrio europaeus]